MLYSATTGGFYDAAIHTNIPDDAVKIPDATYQTMLTGQTAGQVIQPSAAGLPVLAPPPACYETWDAATTAYTTDTDALATAKRAERDARIEAIRWRIERNQSEARLGQTPTDDIAVLDAYVQALRDVPSQPGFPEQVEWPTEPANS